MVNVRYFDPLSIEIWLSSLVLAGPAMWGKGVQGGGCGEGYVRVWWRERVGCTSTVYGLHTRKLHGLSYSALIVLQHYGGLDNVCQRRLPQVAEVQLEQGKGTLCIPDAAHGTTRA